MGEPINESGWYNGIFYRKDRLELVKTETLWLSPTPEKLSKFEGGNGARAVTYAIQRSLSAVDIRLLDHIIVSDNDFISMRDSGMLDAMV